MGLYFFLELLDKFFRFWLAVWFVNFPEIVYQLFLLLLFLFFL